MPLMPSFRRSRRFAILPATLIVLGAALVGCGTSKSSTVTPPGDQGATTTSGGSDTSAPASAGGAGKVTIKSYTFMPASLTVASGTTVTWTNTDSFEHEITGKGSVVFAGPNIKPGGTFSHKFDTPGKYPYICGIHNYMTGTVTVT